MIINKSFFTSDAFNRFSRYPERADYRRRGVKLPRQKRQVRHDRREIHRDRQEIWQNRKEIPVIARNSDGSKLVRTGRNCGAIKKRRRQS
jgi:hypothetical protein